MSSDSRYRYGHAPSALPSAQAIGASHRRSQAAPTSAATESNRLTQSLFPWLSTALATASAYGVAEVFNLHTLWFSLSVLTLVVRQFWVSGRVLRYVTACSARQDTCEL